MKTRQEMIYDFMVAVSANADIAKAYREAPHCGKKFSEYVIVVAKQLADQYLEEQA
jgi:hypothetical protein